jgi:hypothetical protein
MLKENISDIRKERHHITQEDFTPTVIVNEMLDKLPDSVYKDFDKIILDYSCGIGNFLVEALNRRLKNCTDINEGAKALSTICGVELMADNVAECRNRLYSTFMRVFPDAGDKDIFIVRSIIKNRIQWYDSLQFDYKKWPKLDIDLKEINDIIFEEYPSVEDTKYPMWFKDNKVKEIEQSLF